MVSYKSPAAAIKYKNIRCTKCNWRICDAPYFTNVVTKPYEQIDSVRDNHVVCKCQRCGVRHIILMN